VTYGPQSDEPIDEEVPVADAVEQRTPVVETPDLSEDFEPTEVNEIAAEGPPPVDADPADWQEQLTSGPDDEWDPDIE
jgi:hypothetical protein